MTVGKFLREMREQMSTRKELENSMLSSFRKFRQEEGWEEREMTVDKFLREMREQKNRTTEY